MGRGSATAAAPAPAPSRTQEPQPAQPAHPGLVHPAVLPEAQLVHLHALAGPAGVRAGQDGAGTTRQGAAAGQASCCHEPACAAHFQLAISRSRVQLLQLQQFRGPHGHAQHTRAGARALAYAAAQRSLPPLGTHMRQRPRTLARTQHSSRPANAAATLRDSTMMTQSRAADTRQGRRNMAQSRACATHYPSPHWHCHAGRQLLRPALPTHLPLGAWPCQAPVLRSDHLLSTKAHDLPTLAATTSGANSCGRQPGSEGWGQGWSCQQPPRRSSPVH
jgi:hypothetical protein